MVFLTISHVLCNNFLWNFRAFLCICRACSVDFLFDFHAFSIEFMWICSEFGCLLLLMCCGSPCLCLWLFFSFVVDLDVFGDLGALFYGCSDDFACLLQ